MNSISRVNQNRFLTLAFVFFVIVSSTVYGQTTSKSEQLKDNEQSVKQSLKLEDYNLWSQTYLKQISDNGKWYSYFKSYGYRSNSVDTLFIGSTKDSKTFSFPRGYQEKFSSNGKWFSCLVPEKGMALLNLKNGALKWIPQITTFKFSSDGQYLVGLGKESDSEKTSSGLWLIDLNKGEQKFVPDVLEFAINPISNSLVYISNVEGENEVILLKLDTHPTKYLIAKNNKYPYKKLIWNKTGTALVFLQDYYDEHLKIKRHRLYHFVSKQDNFMLSELDLAKHPAIFTNKDIMENYSIMPSDGGNFVSFMVNDKITSQKESMALVSDVQVWSYDDKQIYPKQENDQKQYQGKYKPKLTGWWPLSNKVKLLETENYAKAMLTPNNKYLLSYDPTGDGFFKMVDLFITELETENRIVFLEQQEIGTNKTILISPNSKHIAYFKNKDWWIYNIQKKSHTNLTASIDAPLYEVVNPYPGISSYGSPGWSKDGSNLIFYDQYDVWLAPANGKKPKRITKGRESKMRYRIDNYAYKYKGISRLTFDLSKGLMFKTLGADMKSGYHIWKINKQVQQLVYKDMHIDRLLKAVNKEAYIIKEEAYDVSPRILYWEKGISEPKLLLETNTHQKKFEWGTSELINYKGPEGQQLQGALFYPPNFSVNKKYPMIVHVYELQAYKVNRYVNPSKYMEDGWNTTNFTSEGYVVFYPDIKYKLNDPGTSAAKCLEAGVKAVLAKGFVRKQHIGLIGHSFGGYETAFTITQSNLFAAAVAGAAVTDMVSYYHSVGWEAGLPEMWRLENHQWRFKDSFYENPEAYLRNSPIHYAKNINTPLLLWTGNRDFWLDWEQNIELYMGLRRQGKVCKLLVYPDEEHSIYNDTKNTVDLTNRVKNWFDKYLKPNEKEKK